LFTENKRKLFRKLFQQFWTNFFETVVKQQALYVVCMSERLVLQFTCTD